MLNASFVHPLFHVAYYMHVLFSLLSIQFWDRKVICATVAGSNRDL